MEGGTTVILNGWKDIAKYVGRGVRTVQRWEVLGLPVRRPNARLHSAVVMESDDFDSWFAHLNNGRRQYVDASTQEASCAHCAEMRSTIDRLTVTLTDLRSQYEQLLKQTNARDSRKDRPSMRAVA